MSKELRKLLQELLAERLRPVPPKPAAGYDVEANQRALDEWADQADDEDEHATDES